MARIPTIEEPIPETKPIYDHFIKEHKQVPEWIRVMAWSPRILNTFHEHFKAVMKEGTLDSKLKWHIAHTVSDLNKCEFCISVTRQMLLTLGADPKKLTLKNTDHELSEELHQLAEECTTHSSRVSEELFNKLKQKLDNEQIIEVISTIGLFNYINRFNNSLMILPNL